MEKHQTKRQKAHPNESEIKAHNDAVADFGFTRYNGPKRQTQKSATEDDALRYLAEVLIEAYMMQRIAKL